MDSNKQLTVYKASAGSGKTFTLAKEYMTLVIKDPTCYRNILAVTFTNKATEEMKTRILSKLFSISRRLPDGDDYLKQIKKSLPKFTEDDIIFNAGIALGNLIHNYNYFRVETIDTFFQSVLRNLARELDLAANLRIGLNDEQVEQQAVDEMIEELSISDKVLVWILDYIKENIADDKSWNVIGQIKNFGKNIFKDYYKDNANRINECMNQEGFFEGFAQKMRKRRNDAQRYFQKTADTFFDSLAENNLTIDDFQNKGRGICSYFNKLKNGKFDDDDLVNATLAKCLASETAWVKKTDAVAGKPAYDLVVSKLFKLLQDSEENRPKLLRTYKSADLTIRHLNQLRLLGFIDKKVRELNQDANRFLLSDTQTLLHSLIQEDDSSFIFEKIGTQLEHIMIDEFQDTSTVQWQNFKVLLLETMSHADAGNLIVGDVKQSIYRWRSGDWRLLNNIEKEFPPHSVGVEPLATNFRSDRNIVNFNNAFFKIAKELECIALNENGGDGEQLVKAYNDVKQSVPEGKKKKGYVRIHLVSSSSKNTDEEDYNTKMMRMTLDTINELRDHGVPYNKIAILVRSNKQIQAIADYLMENSNFPLVSDEAFRLDASQSVNLLIIALHYITHPDDDIAKATIIKYSVTRTGNQEMALHFFENRSELLQEPLLDLVEKFYCHFKLSELKQESAYICAFFDKLAAYLIDNVGNIDNFLEEWETSIHAKSIHSDKVDGIQLLSIHKSKGLEFDNVLMPFCDWSLEKVNTIWCSPTEPPYSEMPLVPIDFSAKKMRGSIYEDDYQLEHLQNIVDNLNLLYVAFTRAGRNLFVYGKRGSDLLRSSVIEDCLVNEKSITFHEKGDDTPLAKQDELKENDENKKKLNVVQILQSLDEKEGQNSLPILLEGAGSDKSEDDIYFEYGEIDASFKLDDNAQNDNVFLTQPEVLEPHIGSNPNLREFRPSQKSLDFVNGEDMDEQQQFYIKLGTVLHALFSTIRTKDDVEKALKQLELDGVLYDENVSKEKIERLLRKRLESPLVSDWFSDKWQVMNECNLLYLDENGKVKQDRPDRVLIGKSEIIVIDFKFGKPRDSYHDQVRKYMAQLQQMTGKPTKGYLWYVYPNRVVKVK